MAILPVSLALPSKLSLPTISYNHLSSAESLSLSFSSLSLYHLPNSRTTKPFTVRMGGGPRTFPGGVSKWQWKRMQNKKAKQLLKARLMRERQIYEMRKRAELKAAVSELERPWEVVEQAAPNLFSVGADEQVKVLADRFQKPGGFDLWTENDGPQLFETPDGLPTSRFFPKGVVHSIRPYGRVDLGGIEDEIDEIGMKSVGRLEGGSNLGFDSGQGSGDWLNRSRNSMGEGFSETEVSDEESSQSHSLNSRVFSGANGRRIGKRDMGRKGSGIRRDGDRNLGGRFSETDDSDDESLQSSNSRVFSGVNRRQIGQRDMDLKGNYSQRDGGWNVSGRFSDRNPGGRFSKTEDGYEKSSNSSSSRVFSSDDRRQSGQRSIDERGSGSRRDWNLSGRFSETKVSYEEGSQSSNSRVFSGANRGQNGQRNFDHKGSGNRRDGDFRKIGDRRSAGSGNANGAVRFPDSRQLASNASERRNNGHNQYRRDSRLEKRRNSSRPEDVYDMSLQRDGSYSIGSR